MLRKNILVLSAVLTVSIIAMNANARAEDSEAAPEGPPLTLGEGRAPASEYASRAIAKESGGDEEDEYNFSWLDPDKKVYVLQNRKYRKTGRLAISLAGGLNLSNPYRTEYELVPRADYWFSEQ